MAKKKVSQQEKHHSEVSHQENKPPNPNAMEDPSEKLANLKSLNALLVKETFERRQQVETLESEISRSDVDKQRLEVEKNRFEDQMIEADLEQSLALVFVSSLLNQQAERLEDEIRRGNEELSVRTDVLKAEMEEKIRNEEKQRDEAELKVKQLEREINQFSNDFSRYMYEVREDLGQKQKEADRLRSVVVDVEKNSEEACEEIKRMQVKYDGVVKEKVDAERKLEDLKREIKIVVTEKDEIEQTKIERDLEIIDLKNSVDGLTEDLVLQRYISNSVVREIDILKRKYDGQIQEAERLKVKFLELEKSHAETQKEVQKLQMEKKGFMEEKKERERTLASMSREKDLAERSQAESYMLIEDLKREITEIVADKKETEQEKIQLRATISALQKEEEGLRLKVFELGISNDKAIEKQEKLFMEFNVLMEEKKERERSFENLMEEKNSISRDLEEYKQKLEEEMRKMKEIVQAKTEIEKVEIKKEMELVEQKEEVRKLRSERDGLVEEKKEREERLELLTEVKLSVERNLAEAQLCVEDLQAKKKSAEMFSEQALFTLKNTVARLCGFGDDKENGEEIGQIEEEIKPFAVEMEIIKRAFRNREEVMEDMGRKIEYLQKSLVEAQKKRNLWTWLSSATIFAAVSVAYVSRRR